MNSPIQHDAVEQALFWACRCFGGTSPEALKFAKYLVTQVRGEPWMEELPTVFESSKQTPPQSL